MYRESDTFLTKGIIIIILILMIDHLSNEVLKEKEKKQNVSFYFNIPRHTTASSFYIYNALDLLKYKNYTHKKKKKSILFYIKKIKNEST